MSACCSKFPYCNHSSESVPTITMDDLIEKHFKKFESNDLRLSCFSYYMATGKVNGNFLITLRELMQEYADRK